MGVYCCSFDKLLEMLCVLQVAMAETAEGDKGFGSGLVERFLKAVEAQQMMV